ncbi:ABC transporter permease subunit [Demequina capsici]|uniref:ABC transporter permease subunit n=1 Tax=Demequina capsici TaxID=3075620 RepID=A0AA96F6H0_9MICO|nr:MULTISPECIES: ABC transporter permease subunit [unclassified Demequina]WNM23687.1 ABC transporter permease subunit [Demequina sp. OYTSA14]WNM26526.1 ABC transporter permease subunit [Demequina sp. PMTSA13]
MGRRLPAWATASISAAGLIVVWTILALTVVGPGGTHAIPTPWQVLQGYSEDGLSFYWTHFSVTLKEASLGYLWGNGLALVLSGLVMVIPRLEGVVSQLAVITYCVPIVAIGPLAVIILDVPSKGEPSGTAVFMAALSVFFTTVVGSLLGLHAADKASLDVVSVYGGNGWTQLRKVRFVAALPAVLTALQIAVPAAFLGAVLGEYFGKVETGIGVAMVIAQQSLNAPRVWGIALASGAVALVLYLAVGMLTRLATPWSKGAAA